MTKQEALQQAIQNEIKARNLYLMLAGIFKHRDAESTFKSLSQIERQHEHKLTALYTEEYKIDPDVDQEALPHFKSNHALKDPVEILRFAITQEEDTQAYYLHLASIAEVPDVRTLFRSLGVEESHHKDLLETEITRLEGNMTWFDPSELNGLMED